MTSDIKVFFDKSLTSISAFLKYLIAMIPCADISFLVIVFYSKRSEEYLQLDGVISKKEKPLKDKCCEKYKKGKRCKRCPCFDLLEDA